MRPVTIRRPDVTSNAAGNCFEWGAKWFRPSSRGPAKAYGEPLALLEPCEAFSIFLVSKMSTNKTKLGSRIDDVRNRLVAIRKSRRSACLNEILQEDIRVLEKDCENLKIANNELSAPKMKISKQFEIRLFLLPHRLRNR